MKTIFENFGFVVLFPVVHKPSKRPSVIDFTRFVNVWGIFKFCSTKKRGEVPRRVPKLRSGRMLSIRLGSRWRSKSRPSSTQDFPGQKRKNMCARRRKKRSPRGRRRAKSRGHKFLQSLPRKIG